MCVHSYIVYRISYMKSQSTYLKDIPFYLSTLLLTINRFQCVHVCIYMGFINQQMRRLCKESPQIQKTITEGLCSHNESVEHARSVRSSVCQNLLSDYQYILLYNYLPPKKQKRSINTNRNATFVA